MPVITPPFDTRRIRQYVAEGPAASGTTEVEGLKVGDRLSSVLWFDSGVPFDVTSAFSITATDELTYDDTAYGDLSTGHIVLLLVHKTRPADASAPSTPEPEALVFQIFYGNPWEDEPLFYDINEWMSDDSFLYCVLSFPMVDTDPIVVEVTTSFELSAGGITRTTGDSGVDPLDDDTNRALLVVWSRPSVAYDLTLQTASGTSSGVNVAMSGITSGDDLMGVLAFEDGEDVVERTSEYAPGTDEFVKASGTDETGNTLLFAAGAAATEDLHMRMTVGSGDTGGLVHVTGVDVGDEIYALIYTNPETFDPSIVSNGVEEFQNTILAVEDGFTVTPNEEEITPQDYTGVVFIVFYKDNT